jgi:diguanylate cyclase (GGDEF)-like protein
VWPCRGAHLRVTGISPQSNPSSRKSYRFILDSNDLDLDNFKQINDTLGHRKEVEVLKAVTSGSVQSLRRTDIVGRLGGDEFAVPMPETEGEETVAVLSAVRCKTSRHQLKRVYR